MKVSYQWLADFVTISLPADELACRLTMAGLEVKAIEPAGQDSVFEIEITSNRPDWLSICGVAREVAALTGARLHQPALPRLRPANAGQACRISVERSSDCPLYTGWIIRGVRVGASPSWLQKRLEAVGCRSVNNVVDITNYFLFAYGQPLHAFDLDRLAGGCVGVRRARSGEQITAIDAAVKQLSPDILVITDAEKPVAIAGVIGGKDSEVTQSTVNILLESAVFHPVIVRRGRQKLALQTEASYRFERGVDAAQTAAVAQRACAMIIELCGGILTAVGSRGSAAVKRPSVSVDLSRVSSMLNVKIPAAGARKMLEPLGFGVTQKKGGRIIAVDVPSFRQDVCGDVDVLEEIARIYGYERIPSSLPRVALQHAGDDTHRRIMSVKNILAATGLYEAVTYSLVDRQLLAAFGVPAEGLVGMQDPLNQDQEIMRTSLVPSLCRVVSHNLKQQQSSVRVFEVARVYSHDAASGRPAEAYRLAVCLCGTRQLWYGRQYAHVSDEDGLLHLKGIVSELCRCLGAGACTFRCVAAAGKQQTVEIEIDGAAAGSCYQLGKKALEHVDIKNRDVFALELDLGVLFASCGNRRMFRDFSRLPSVARDISIVIDRAVGAAAVLAAVRENAGPLLADCTIADFYTGSPVPPGKKNLTLSCVYASSQRTLQEQDVLTAHTAVIAALKEKFGAQLR